MAALALSPKTLSLAATALILLACKASLSSQDNKAEPSLVSGIKASLSHNSIDRELKTKDLSALKETYNITFNQRGYPNIHASLASRNTILLKVQQNEFINEARTQKDFIEEKFNSNISINAIRIIFPDGNSVKPLTISRKSKIANSLKESNHFIVDHFFYLELPQNLNFKSKYTIQFLDNRLKNFTFTPRESIILALHHNRVYDTRSPIKRAKLSSWTGKAGISYEAGGNFQIRSESSGNIVFAGIIDSGSKADKFTGTEVFNLDFSDLNQPGRYRIEINGLGKSLPFEIRQNVWKTLTDLILEGLYNHRAFHKLDGRHSNFVRPGNNNITFYQSQISEAELIFLNAGNRFNLLPNMADRNSSQKLVGGWFDAGDYDTNVEHLSVISTLVDLYDSNRSFFKEFGINIPESGDNIPDILNEALWGIQLYEQLQTPEGGVSSGFEFDSHPEGTTSWEETEAFIYAPDFYASYHFAIAAAKLATAITPFDEIKANELKQRSIQAMDWAEREYSVFPFLPNSHKTPRANRARQFAAIELYRITRNPKYHDIFISIDEKHNYDAAYTYSQLGPNEYPELDLKWQNTLKSKLIQYGDQLVEFGTQNGFDTIHDPKFPQNWGFNTIISTQHANYLAKAHQLTQNPAYLNALAASMSFGLGMNPDNMAFTTGTVARKLAYDEPDDVLHADGMHLDNIPDGITIYGFFGQPWFAWPVVNKATQSEIFNTKTKELKVPFLESFHDYHNLVPMAEYTIHQTIVDQAFAFGYLAGQTHQ